MKCRRGCRSPPTPPPRCAPVDTWKRVNDLKSRRSKNRWSEEQNAALRYNLFLILFQNRKVSLLRPILWKFILQSLEDMKMKKHAACVTGRTDGRKYGQTQIQLWKHFNLSKFQFSGLMDGQWMWEGLGKRSVIEIFPQTLAQEFYKYS